MQIIGVGGALCDQRIVVVNRSVRQRFALWKTSVFLQAADRFPWHPQQNPSRPCVRFRLYQRNAKRHPSARTRFPGTHIKCSAARGYLPQNPARAPLPYKSRQTPAYNHIASGSTTYVPRCQMRLTAFEENRQHHRRHQIPLPDVLPLPSARNDEEQQRNRHAAKNHPFPHCVHSVLPKQQKIAGDSPVLLARQPVGNQALPSLPAEILPPQFQATVKKSA